MDEDNGLFTTSLYEKHRLEKVVQRTLLMGLVIYEKTDDSMWKNQKRTWTVFPGSRYCA
ncbi:UNVERIFIED_CONTAM: hypothetical protein ABID98_001644 [Brevibacillus sp. OAP136]